MKSAAYALGVKAGYQQNIGLPDRIFYKIASRTGFNPAEIKQVFLEKSAIDWGKMLMPAGVGMAAGAGAYQLGKGLLGGGQATNPVALDPKHKQMVDATTYNQGLSRDMQGAQGAFGAAPNPMGKTGSALSKESASKVAGFWGGLAGGVLGAPLGLGGMAGGAALGSAIGDKVSGGGGQVKNPVALDPYHKRLVNTTMYNQGLSRDLQAARGAFAPAANPFGNS